MELKLFTDLIDALGKARVDWGNEGTLTTMAGLVATVLGCERWGSRIVGVRTLTPTYPQPTVCTTVLCDLIMGIANNAISAGGCGRWHVFLHGQSGGTKTNLAGGSGGYSAHCDAGGKARHLNLML